MANQRTKQYVTCTGHTMHQTSGGFSCNGTNAITNVIGNGFTAVRTTTGQFTVTLNSPYPQLLQVDPSIVCSTTVQAILTAPTAVSVTSGGGSTPASFVIVNSSNTGTALDLAAGFGLAFTITAQNSSLTK